MRANNVGLGTLAPLSTGRLFFCLVLISTAYVSAMTSVAQGPSRDLKVIAAGLRSRSGLWPAVSFADSMYPEDTEMTFTEESRRVAVDSCFFRTRVALHDLDPESIRPFDQEDGPALVVRTTAGKPAVSITMEGNCGGSQILRPTAKTLEIPYNSKEQRDQAVVALEHTIRLAGGKH